MAVPERIGMVLCTLETSLYPHTVLCKGVAERIPFASAAQARGRGSTRRPETTLAARCIGAGAGVQSQAREQGERPMRSAAFGDALRWSLQSALPRLLTGGVLAVRQQLSPFPHEMHPASEQVPRGAHLRRR